MFAHRKFAIGVLWFAMERRFAFVKIEIDRAQKERKNTIYGFLLIVEELPRPAWRDPQFPS